MEHERLLVGVLADLAEGRAGRAREECATRWERAGDPVDASLASLASFWIGEYEAATAWAGRALDDATDDAADDTADDRVRALARAAAALAAGGDPAADGRDAWAGGVALLLAAPDPGSRWWIAVRYLLAEAALVGARLDDAVRVVATGSVGGPAWAGHPFAVVMAACAVRAALFAGDVAAASELLEPLRAAALPGPRSAAVVEAVAGVVLGNADDPGGVTRSLAAATAVRDGERDFLDRGVLLLLAFGAIAVGDVAEAARLVFAAGDDGDLGSCTIIDRALGLELLLVAALEQHDLAAAEIWLEASASFASHPTARPTVQRAHSRYLLAVGDVGGARAAGEASVLACRQDGRLVEAAEGEIVLARARIAAEDVAGAARDLRALVEVSDASGHHAVRRSAATTLHGARRRLPPVAGGGWSALSAREQEVGRCVLDGLDVDDIAAALHLSPRTVRSHVSRVLCAFAVATRIGLLAAVRPAGPDLPVPPPAALSPRQADVARAVAAGATNQQVATALGISVKGVEKHVSDILVRWSARSRFELARTWWAGEGAGTTDPQKD